MVTKALLIRLEAKRGADANVESLLPSIEPIDGLAAKLPREKMSAQTAGA
jgi:hypothetical protein